MPHDLILFLTAVMLVVAAVYIHLVMFQLLVTVARKLTYLKARHIVGAVLIAMVTHSLEIATFAGRYSNDGPTICQSQDP